MENLTELASSIKDYEKNSDSDFPDLAGFLEEAALMTDVDNYDASADSVVMMTMHAAKGLEFPVVFLPGFEDGIFPGMQTIYQPEEMEEERRLCYVAITRAKEELYLLHANSRMLYGSTTRNRVSRFLQDIPEELTPLHAAVEGKCRFCLFRQPGKCRLAAETGFRQRSFLWRDTAANCRQHRKAKELYTSVGRRQQHFFR